GHRRNVNALVSKFDAAGFALALLVHAAALLYVYLTPPLKTRRVTTVQVEIRKPKPPPPPVTPPEPPPPPPPPPPKKPAQKPAAKQLTVKPPQPPPETPQPAKPVFGIDPSQTGGDGIELPVGNTTIADPAKRPKVTEAPPPLPPAAGIPGGTEYR